MNSSKAFLLVLVGVLFLLSQAQAERWVGPRLAAGGVVALTSIAVILPLAVVVGLYAIGFMGLFVGQILIGALRATLDVYREQYGSVTGG